MYNANVKEKVLLRFLQQTKQGKYAKIEKSSLKYVRVKEQRELIDVPPSAVNLFNTLNLV